MDDRLFEHEYPTFALGTSGAEIMGKNVLVERLKITNFDDAIAIKPGHMENKFAKCAENMIIRDSKVHYGIGMSIGSVAPLDSYACVRNVTF